MPSSKRVGTIWAGGMGAKRGEVQVSMICWRSSSLRALDGVDLFAVGRLSPGVWCLRSFLHRVRVRELRWSVWAQA